MEWKWNLCKSEVPDTFFSWYLSLNSCKKGITLPLLMKYFSDFKWLWQEIVVTNHRHVLNIVSPCRSIPPVLASRWLPLIFCPKGMKVPIQTLFCYMMVQIWLRTENTVLFRIVIKKAFFLWQQMLSRSTLFKFFYILIILY